MIREACGGGNLLPVETMLTPEARHLDLLGGIDCWQVVPALGTMRGLAVRVQERSPTWSGPWPFATFTIREARVSGTETEYPKRLRAVQQTHGEGWLYPALTVQAYVPSFAAGGVDAVAVARTLDLFKFIHYGTEGIHYTRRRTGDATMIVVDWELYRTLGAAVLGHAPWLWTCRPGDGSVT